MKTFKQHFNESKSLKARALNAIEYYSLGTDKSMQSKADKAFDKLNKTGFKGLSKKELEYWASMEPEDLDEKDILTISRDEFIKKPIKGFEYSTDDDQYIAQRDRKQKVTRLTDRFFTRDKLNRRLIIGHEFGHDLLQGANDFNKYFLKVAAPFEVGRDKYDDFFGSGSPFSNASEFVANAYMALLTGEYKQYEKGGKVWNLIDAVRSRAKKLGLPTGK